MAIVCEADVVSSLVIRSMAPRAPPICISGASRFLDAAIVALSQPCGGQRWYTSTAQLQLASPQLCVACRGVATLQLKVTTHTPRFLWAGPTASRTRSIKRRSLDRVPLLRPRGVRWDVPAVMSAATTHPFSDVVSVAFGSRFTARLDDLLLPRRIKAVHFGSSFNRSIAHISWPASLEKLSLGLEFDQPIQGIVLPAYLQQLNLQSRFNQPIIRVVSPATLVQLPLGPSFDQPISRIVWPPKLAQLSI